MTSRVRNTVGDSWYPPCTSHPVRRIRSNALIHRILAAVSLSLLYGCGGGGGGGMEINVSFQPISTVRNVDVVASAPFSISRDSAARSRLVLSGVNGSVEVNGAAAGSSVVVSGEREVGSDSLADAQAQLQQLNVEVEEVGTDIVVRTVQPPIPGGRRYTVNYRIQLPASFAVNIVNVNGSVNLRAITGKVDTSVVNGGIEATLEPSASGSIELTADNGDIRLRLPQSTSASLSAEVGLGSITLTGLALQGEVRTSTLLQGTLGLGTGTVYLKTTNGSIWIDDLT